MALLCAPRIVQANSVAGFSPVETASAGISGNRAGATTPVVELKKLMKAATRLNAIGTRAVGTFEPIHAQHRVDRTGLYGNSDQHTGSGDHDNRIPGNSGNNFFLRS